MNVVAFSQPRSMKLSRRNRSRSKPMDPVEAARLAALARRDPSLWGLNRDALDLPANAEVVAEGDTRKNTARATRYDVFALMYYRANSRLSTASYDAVRRLQKDLAILHRTEGTSDAIRTSSGTAAHFITEDFRIAQRDAGERITEALGALRPWRAKLIRELCETEVVRGETPDWHAIVRRYTGAIPRARRSEVVRLCSDDLARSYRDLDNAPRRALA